MDRNSRLVTQLVRDGAIADPHIEDAFRKVQRHWFLPDADPEEIYRDVAVVTKRRPDGVAISSSSQPGVMARMLAQLEVRPGDRVLEIGAGTGYNAALLAQLVGPGGEVVTIDVDPGICASAGRRLHDAGVSNVSVLAGDGWSTIQGSGRFDRIEATVGVWDLSTAWVKQLQGDGILVAPLWLRAGLQAAVAFRKAGARLESVDIEPCGFMRLIGPGAGEATYEGIGPWTVSFDEASPERAGLLRALLHARPHVEPAPVLANGWFTPIALGHPDAVHLFMGGSGGSVIGRGIVDAVSRGLALVVSHPADGDTIRTFGAPRARQHLLGLIQTEAPVGLKNLTITAIPAGQPAGGSKTLGILERPNFSFLLCRS